MQEGVIRAITAISYVGKTQVYILLEKDATLRKYQVKYVQKGLKILYEKCVLLEALPIP